MKLTTLIMTIFLLQVAAAGRSQITIRTNQAKLQSVLEKISEQSGYDFVYSDNDFKNTKAISVKLNNATIEKALQVCFADQPLSYQISEKTVIVKRKEEKGFFKNLVDRFQAIDVRGRVVDEKGSPLPGATVKVKGSGKTVTTNANGEFYIPKVDDSEVLVITYTGYLSKEVNANLDLSAVELELSNSKLDEVQVIAYGTVSSKFSTSNVGNIQARDIQNQPLSNIQLALSGRVPGLFIRQGSGVSASNVDVVVQGKNSIGNGNDPFYVVDGVPYSPTFTNNTLMGAAIAGTTGNTLSFINPADIENISILKDADATAIYGSRAANGAILITTKKGKAGKTKVDLSLQNGWGKISNKYALLNTDQYLNLRRERFINDGQTLPSHLTTPTTSNYDLTVWDLNKNTDWQEELVGGTAQLTNLQASLSGGSATTQFLASYGFIRETTVYPNNLADVKGNIHFNLNHNSIDNKFKYLLNASHLQGRNRLNSGDLMVRTASAAPNAPNIYNPDGTVNWSPLPTNSAISTNRGNPALMINAPFDGRTNNLIANNTISYEIIPGLQILSSMGLNRLSGAEEALSPITLFRPELPNKTRSAKYLDKSINSWIIEPQITYNKATNAGNFNILIGGTIQQTNTDVFQQTGSNYASDSQLKDIAAAPNVVTDINALGVYKYNALFGRINYLLKDKYVINLTARRDGSSRFGSENKLHNFYSIGGAWLFGAESFFKNNISWLTFGKLRANYGTTGNDQISDYRYLSLLQNFPVEIPYSGANGIYAINIANPFLQWEETRKLNLGIDLGFIKDRIMLSANYFRNRSSNQLVKQNLPYTTGFMTIDKNIDAVIQNSGLEFQLDGNILSGGKFDWRLSGNLTIPKNKLVSFPGLENSVYKELVVVGKSFNITRTFKYAGVNPQTGLYEFLGADGQTTSRPAYNTDRTETVDLNPKYYGGIANTFQYAGLTLDVLFQFVKQRGLTNRFGTGTLGAFNGNQPTFVLDHWKKPGDVVDIQKVSFSDDALTANDAAHLSDELYGNASYIRLKNIALSYSLRKKWLERLHIEQARVFVQGQNLWTITRYKGLDPETQATNSIPPLRMINAGIQITF